METVHWGGWERGLRLRGSLGALQAAAAKKDAKVGQYLRGCVCGRFPQRGTGLAVLQWQQGARGVGIVNSVWNSRNN